MRREDAGAPQLREIDVDEGFTDTIHGMYSSINTSAQYAQ
jgi:hypothetical protein